MSVNDNDRDSALPAADDSVIDEVLEIEHQEPVDMTALPDYQRPDKDAEQPEELNEVPQDELSYGKEGAEGSFTKGAADAADGPELACGSDSAIEAALQAGK